MATITIELTDDQLQKIQNKILKILGDGVEMCEDWDKLALQEIGDDLVNQMINCDYLEDFIDGGGFSDLFDYVEED